MCTNHADNYSRKCHKRFCDSVNQALADSADTDTYVAKLPHLFINIVSEASAQLKRNNSHELLTYNSNQIQ